MENRGSPVITIGAQTLSSDSSKRPVGTLPEKTIQDKVLKLARHVPLVCLHKFCAAIFKKDFRSDFMGKIV